MNNSSSLLNFATSLKSQFFLHFQEEFVPLALDFDTHRSICVVGGSQDVIFTLEYKHSEKCFTVMTQRSIPTKGVSSLCLRKADGKLLFGGCWDSSIRFLFTIIPTYLL